MTEITPAILSPTLAGITASLTSLQGAAQRVQIDVADGILVPHQTWPYTSGEDITALVIPQEVSIEADLMVVHPLPDAQAWIAQGATRVILHSESPHSIDALEALQTHRHSRALGIALPCGVSSEDFKPFEKLVDFVQIMGIARIGQQGEPLDERVVGLLSALRWVYPHLDIQVDGGVRKENIRALIEAGANRMVVGSAIFSSSDPVASFVELQGQ